MFRGSSCVEEGLQCTRARGVLMSRPAEIVYPVVSLGMPGDAFMYGTLVTRVNEARLS